MKSPQYYVQSLELELDPNLNDIDFGGSSLDFEVDDSPEYRKKDDELLFEANLGLEFNCYPASFHDTTRDTEDEVGSADIEVLVVLEGDEKEFEDYVSVWNEDGYRAVDWDFRYHIESGFITDVFSPIADVVDNSFRGVLPGLAFTEPPTSEPEGLSIERTEFLRQYLAENIKLELMEYISKVSESEFSEEDVRVTITEQMNDVKVEWPDEIEDEYEEDVANQIISSVFQRIIQEEVEEDIAISSVEIISIDEENE